jgi:hypothetical protein
MRTENGLMIDMSEVASVIDAADVFAMGFRQIPERLLVDTRHDMAVGPLVALVQPLGSVAERFFWLGQQRPTLGVPQRFMFLPWPHSIAFLEESGIWERISKRVLESGHPQAGAMLDQVLRDLKERDHQANLAAVTGVGYQQIWPRQRQLPG